MRIKIATITAVLVLAFTTMAWAQTSAATTPQTTAGTSLGTIDFGARFTTTSGDEARYERYSDHRDGLYSKIVFGKKTDTLFWSASANNIGYHDQAYRADYFNGKMKGYGLWSSIPLNYSYLTSTPWVNTSSGEVATFTLNPVARAAVQSNLAMGIPLSASDLAKASIYRGLATPFDMQQRRDVAGFGMGYDVKPDLNLNFSFTTTKKSGTMPWAASYAFRNANELPLPLDNRSNDLSIGAEWANKDGMIRVGWDSSWFTNQYNNLVWDNPLRATDYDNGKVPPLGPYDPSGYSNGNGPARGRMSLPPDSSMNVLSALGLYKMPSHSTLSASVSFTNMKQNDTLIPWTINPVIAQPLVYAAFPELASLHRDTAEAEVRGLNALFNFTTRPNRYFAFTMKYRYNNHDNRTPEFDAVEYVRFDAVPEETGGETHALDVKRRTLDVNASFRVAPYTSLRVGYGFDAFNRSGRTFSDMTDDIFRISLDTTKSQYVNLRATYEHSVRLGSGFSEASLEEGGAQPGLRYFDESDRDRDRTTLLFVLMPTSTVDVTFSYAQGKDVYKGEGHEFGLLSTDNWATNIGLSYTPVEHIAFGVNWGRDDYKANQKSRNANPPPDPSWTDPNRDWLLDNNEVVNNFLLYLDVLQAMKDTDLRFAYDYSDSDNGFVFSGPRIAGLLPNFEQLPNVTNKWHRFTADLKHYFTAKVGVGFAWYYEKLDVTDFATIDTNGSVGYTTATGTPRIDYLGEISTGYGVRPYKGNTGTIRLLYKF